MSTEFDGTVGQYIDYGLVSDLHNLAQKTVLVFFALDSLPSSALMSLVTKANSIVEGWSLFIDSLGARVNRLDYWHRWSISNGYWTTNDNIATTNVRDFAITYDRGAVGNNPIFYVDGSSVAINEIGTPAGIVNNDSDKELWFGGGGHLDDKTMDGRINGAFVWNRILSAIDIASISSKRSINGHKYGLIFAERFIGAAGLQVYDSATLTAPNKFTDSISGVRGTPMNSPIGRTDTYMSYRG